MNVRRLTTSPLSRGQTLPHEVAQFVDEGLGGRKGRTRPRHLHTTPSRARWSNYCIAIWRRW